MDLSILTYVSFENNSWRGRIECVGFDQHGFPYFQCQTWDHTVDIWYNSVDRRWTLKGWSAKDLEPRRLWPFVPFGLVWEKSLETPVASNYPMWILIFRQHKTYRDKIVPFSWKNMEIARNRSIWKIKDISRILVVVCLRLKILLPGEMLTTILSFLDIIIK